MEMKPRSTRELVLDAIDAFMEAPDLGGLCHFVAKVTIYRETSLIVDREEWYRLRSLLAQFSPLDDSYFGYWWGRLCPSNSNYRMLALAFMLAIAEAEEKEHA